MLKDWLKLIAIVGTLVAFIVAFYAAIAAVYGTYVYIGYRAFCLFEGC